MSSKLLIILCTLCIVNASVIMVIYDDADNKDVSLDSGCNPQACDQLCRRLGFTGGACVGDKCDCDNFRQINGKLLSDRYKYKTIESVEECSDVACAQVCHKLGFPAGAGACSDEKCDCDKINSEEKVKTPFEKFWQVINQSNNFEENQIEPKRKIATCNDATCNYQCILIGYQRGMCYVGYCQCFN